MSAVWRKWNGQMDSPINTQDGFTESWLRRCGERPKALIVQSGFALLIAWLLLGLGGFSCQRFDPSPPVPQAVMYRLFMEGGDRARGLETAIDANGMLILVESEPVQIDPTLVPEFDPLKVQPNKTGHSKVRNPASEWRIVNFVATEELTYGWPQQLVEWRAVEIWDVTDPTREFASFPGFYKNYFSSNLLGDGTWLLGIASKNGARLAGARINVAAVAGIISLCFGIPSLLVIPSCTLHRRRQRRRLRQGRCLRCDHLLGPPPTPQQCPECGEPTLGRIP